MLVQRVHNTEKHSQTPTCDFFLYAKQCKLRLQVFSRNWTDMNLLLQKCCSRCWWNTRWIWLYGIDTVWMYKQRYNNRPERSQYSWKTHFDSHPERESPGKDGKTRLKMVTRSTQDTKKMQDERMDTIGELWHKLWGKWGLPDKKLNTWTGTATDAHRQDRGSLPELRMNSVTLLSHYSTSSPSPLLSFNAQRTAGLSL